MTAPTDEFDQPCPHDGSVDTCNDCYSDFATAERLIEGLPPHPKDGEGIEAD